MNVVILAGGLGTRISEETDFKPKPMIEIGGKPILWHIMKVYSYYGFNDFIICLGYKGYLIKEYFANYFIHQSDVTFDLRNNETKTHGCNAEPWRVTLVDTGLKTMTGGRIKRVQKFIGDKTFMLTYGDGIADVNIAELIKFHRKHEKYATVTAVLPEGKFGALNINKKSTVKTFLEKPSGGSGWISGGFFVLEPSIFEYLEGDDSIWEREPVERLAQEGHLVAYKHNGFWRPMDTLRDKRALDMMWNSGEASDLTHK